MAGAKNLKNDEKERTLIDYILISTLRFVLWYSPIDSQIIGVRLIKNTWKLAPEPKAPSKIGWSEVSKGRIISPRLSL